MILALLLAGAAPASQLACSLTPSDRALNRQLTFKQFDQEGSIASAARALAQRGCFATAAVANIDFLLHGSDLPDYERNVVRFHTGQYLATSGKEQEAALLIASTRRGTDPKRPTFDWDTYVIGTYAFLTKDRPLLDAMTAKLTSMDDFGNKMNSELLRRFQRCFDQPYRIAYGVDKRCAAPAK